MLPGRHLFVFMVKVLEMNSVPAQTATIQVTIDKFIFLALRVQNQSR